MTSPARRPRNLSPLAAGGILLIPIGLVAAGCSIGIDDRPVPPALIPLAAGGGEAAEYGAPTQDYSRIAAAPAVAAAPEASDAFPPAPSEDPGNGGMVWQEGAQPVTEASDLAPLESSASEEAVADAAPAEAEPQVEAAAAEAEEPIQPDGPPAASHAGAFRVAPFVGVEGTSSGSLLRALKVQAEVRGVALDGGTEAMVLKTYLSSYPEGGETVLTYVFDVYAADGTRLTRIDGQERVPAGDWADAPPDLVKAVAKKAMRRLEAWQAGAEA